MSIKVRLRRPITSRRARKKKKKNREKRRKLTKAERGELNSIENRPQSDPETGRDDRDGLCFLVGNAIANDFSGSLDGFSNALRKNGGPADKSVVTRMRNGAKPIATDQIAPLVLALGVEPGNHRFALLMELIAVASTLRSVEKLIDKQKLVDPVFANSAPGKRQAAVVLAALPVLRVRTRELAAKLGVKVATRRQVDRVARRPTPTAS